jgi:hypothetical protein
LTEALLPTYTYLGPGRAYFPTLGRELAAGDTAELDTDPGDGRWSHPDTTAAPPAPPIPTDPGPAGADPQHAEEATDA